LFSLGFFIFIFFITVEIFLGGRGGGGGGGGYELETPGKSPKKVLKLHFGILLDTLLTTFLSEVLDEDETYGDARMLNWPHRHPTSCSEITFWDSCQDGGI